SAGDFADDVQHTGIAKLIVQPECLCFAIASLPRSSHGRGVCAIGIARRIAEPIRSSEKSAGSVERFLPLRKLCHHVPNYPEVPVVGGEASRLEVELPQS